VDALVAGLREITESRDWTGYHEVMTRIVGRALELCDPTD